ncbi:pyridine nucleotide-disulfide oxidoreductase [Saccharopolyspora erythraea NRRL 2338]|uniref:Possible flavin binding monooxygenase n=2 Tax=Saccharopolyspora erythraea TaxID=1836 RepID=A4FJM0_SACEN|nr:FAD-dependent oxidoreductase [Saccharopolyspora erythraea]EQD82648.1 flavoprotein [Saccharopolyspora erythraea D]PFG97894.1 pyridine nucleotide-disulfide oxidoreductase [Saccharopolyspora erythraea NRRL 2338]QRK88031.1 FAD-dependent oxidoreductase [Saccharopolyspora erythraea]CAM04245.1 possible flavin binding monooxygenase [Saccharopolyspora erythraea NRRL 2338]
MDEMPIVIVGAGPVGLAAAAHVAERGLDPLVLEAGSQAGASVREWGHVRLFSQWSELIDPAAARLLDQHGWQRPDPAGYPTGADWVAGYLQPLAAALGARVRFNARVSGVARRGRDRVVDAGREAEPLTVHVATADGDERITARAVIDASGTWGSPNPLGGDGLPALGEHAASERITYRGPDLTDPQQRARYAGKRIAIAGSGHTALTALVSLARLAETEPGTEIVWILRRGTAGTVFGGGEADQLPARGALGQRAKQAAEAGYVRTVTGFRTASVETDGDDRLVLTSFEGTKTEPVDEIVVATGFRPELSWLSEIRLGLDPVLQAPVELAPLIDPNVHSCGTVYPHGAKELAHPEPGVFLAGMKSYGRAPTFLAMTGYEQVRSLAAALAGDTEAAERVELVLPETGVCGGAGLFDEPEADQGGGCCSSPQAELVDLSAPASRER